MEIVIGLSAPFIIDFLNKYIPDSKVRFLISFVACVVVAIIINYANLISGNYSHTIESFGIIFSTAQAMYKLLWADSAIRDAMGLKS